MRKICQWWEVLSDGIFLVHFIEYNCWGRICTPTHLTGYAKNERPCLFFIWAISQGCVCSMQPLRNEVTSLSGQRVGLFSACYKLVGSPSSVFDSG